MPPTPAPKPKLQPIDWAVLVGGPVAFLVIAILGIRALLGPAPAPNPIEVIREGQIRVGTPGSEVLGRLGRPTSTEIAPDGTTTLRYTRTDWSAVTKERDATLAQNEAIIELGPDGRVRSVRVEHIPVPDAAP